MTNFLEISRFREIFQIREKCHNFLRSHYFSMRSFAKICRKIWRIFFPKTPNYAEFTIKSYKPFPDFGKNFPANPTLDYDPEGLGFDTQRLLFIFATLFFCNFVMQFAENFHTYRMKCLLFSESPYFSLFS